MRPKLAFEAASTVEQALRFLDEGEGRAQIIAGGTDIIPGIRQGSARFAAIDRLVDINGIESLKTISLQDGALVIGAACTLTQISNDPLILAHVPLLAQAVSAIGSVQIRNRATIAGNFVNNSPCADSVPPLLVYDAQVQLMGRRETRMVSLEEFLLRPYHTQIRQDELVTAIVVTPSPGLDGEFVKLGRRRGVAISRITLALLARIESGRFAQMRLASGAVTPIGMRFRRLEQEAQGKRADKAGFIELARSMGQTVLEVTGLRYSTPYKLPVLQQLLFQALCRLDQSGGRR